MEFWVHVLLNGYHLVLGYILGSFVLSSMAMLDAITFCTYFFFVGLC